METPSRQPDWLRTLSKTAYVNMTAISGNGNYMVAGTFMISGKGETGIFCYDRNGNQVWKATEQNVYKGSFWVDISANGGVAASGGANKYEGNGYVRAYEVIQGRNILDDETSFTTRVNEVRLTPDGQRLVAVGGKNVALYSRKEDGLFHGPSLYTSGIPRINIDSVAFAQDYILAGYKVYSSNRIAQIADNVRCLDELPAAVAKAEVEDAGEIDAYIEGGGILLFRIDSQGNITDPINWKPISGASPAESYTIRVAITEDAEWFASSDSQGHIQIFNMSDFISAPQPNYAWTCRPEGYYLKNVYGLAMRSFGKGRVILAGGATGKYKNEPDWRGYVYMIQNIPDSRVESDYNYQVNWINSLPYFVNPSVTVDSLARFVTAAIGQPVPGGLSPGSFSLLDNRGNHLWYFNTDYMNWPMNISADATAIFGGSDTGCIYFWNRN